MYLVRNVEKCNLQKTVWCDGCLQLVEIGTGNVNEVKLNNRLGYSMVRLYN